MMDEKKIPLAQDRVDVINRISQFEKEGGESFFENAELVAVCDIDENKIRWAEENLVGVKTYNNYSDLLSSEELLVKKFKMLASLTEDAEIKKKYERISEQHQGHFNALYRYLQ